MTDKVAHQSIIRRHPWLSSLGIFVGVIILLAIALRIWITTSWGNGFVLSQINGREIAGYGTLEADGLNGDPLTRMSLASLRIRDKEGVWLTAKEAQIAWSPWPLMSKHVDLSDITVKSIAIARRPVRTPQPPSTKSKANWTVSLDKLKVDELSLAEDLAGRAADFTVDGTFLTRTNGTLEVSLDVSPISDTPDYVSLKATRDIAGTLSANLDALASADGPFASMMNLPVAKPLALEGSASGTEDSGDGFLQLTLDGETRGDMTTSWTPSAFSANLTLDASQLPLPEQIIKQIGGQTRLSLEAGREGNTPPLTLHTKFATGSIDASGAYNAETFKPIEGLNILVRLDDLTPIAGHALTLSLDGALIGANLLGFEGRTIIANPTSDNLPFKEISGPLQFALKDGKIPFTALLDLKGVAFGNERLDRIVSTSLTLSLVGAWNTDDRSLSLSPSSLKTGDGIITVQGVVNTQTDSLDLSGQLNQPVNTFLPDANGRIAGPFKISGKFDDANITTRLSGKDIRDLPIGGDSIIGASPVLSADIGYAAKTITFTNTRLNAASLTTRINGSFRSDGISDLSIDLSQSAALSLNGTNIIIGDAEIIVRGPSNSRAISITSDNGRLQTAGQTLENLNLDSRLLQTGSSLSGPLNAQATINESPATLSTNISRSSEGWQANDILADIAGLRTKGQIAQTSADGLTAKLDILGENYDISGSRFGAIDVEIDYAAPAGEQARLTSVATITNTRLPNGLVINSMAGTAKSTPDGYAFDIKALREHPARPIDLVANGIIETTEGLSGKINLNGTLLGQTVNTRRPISFSTADAFSLDTNIDLFGGDLEAHIKGTSDQRQIYLSLNNVDPSPIALMFGLPSENIRLNGAGTFSPYGQSPSGDLALSARTDLPGLEANLVLDLTGRLTGDVLQLNLQGVAADKLNLSADAAIPVTPNANGIVALNRRSDLQARAEMVGDLSGLRNAALAYGHDIGGSVDSKLVVHGKIDEPVINGTISLTNGLYEFGRTGMQLKDIDLVATLTDDQFSLAASGQGQEKGRFEIRGQQSPEAVDLNTKVYQLPVYDRDGDIATVSGDLDFRVQNESRSIEGTVTVDEARFDIDHLPNSRSNAIDVRWKGEQPFDGDERISPRPTSLDINLQAPRKIYVTGRGLNSEWSLDTNLSGTLSDPRLTGKARMLRGDLDLAGSPFEFDTGLITFYGAPSDSQIELKAARTVDGLTANVAVTGSITGPDLDLSSSPDLPQDEILSRLLFGRSAIDLSAIEAAQLASSISRLTGNGTSLDPAASLQAALGVDRLSIGTSADGNAQLGIGEYVADDVYLQVKSAASEGSSVDVEWQPRPQLSVESSTTTTGETELRLKWKKDY